MPSNAVSAVTGGTSGGSGAIELRDVTKRYGDERVVDAITASIRPGEFFSLLGPSGSGKTTTLLMIAGFAQLDEGRILVDGRDISRVPPQRRNFGMVFQNYAIFPHLNVFENVAFPLRARGTPDREMQERVNAALALVRLDRFTDRYARQLSGGQQQRVAIARAIVFHPSVVLMDEPLGALDKNLRYQMQVEIKEIQRRLGMTVVYVTHDQEEAMNMSDRIAIMNNGRISQLGPPADVYEHPRDVFTARFLGEANLLSGTLEDAASGCTMFRTASGSQLKSAASRIASPGTAGNLFVRPERVGIWPRSAAPDLGDEYNRATGCVAQASYLGNIVRYAVEIAAGERMTIDVQNASGTRVLAAGENVVVAWRVADSLVLFG